MIALDDPQENKRYAIAFGVVLALHGLVALVAIFWLTPIVKATPVESAIMFDMAPPAAPPEPPSERPPGPKQEKAEPKPKKLPDPLKTQPAVPNLDTPRKVTVQETTAPVSPPLPPAPRLSNAAPTWQGLVLARLNKFKRYPGAAQARRQQGIAYVRFVVDREGRVTAAQLERSSGFAALDQEALAATRRAQPLPKPPDEIPGQTIELIVPFEFFIR